MNTEQSVLARFICSSQRWTQCPPPDRPEVAFIGRSNVGKSSLINMLTQQEGLAKVSATPGKTQLINHFLINEKWYLVDLPGYGFAQVPKPIREQFESMIRDYILHRKNRATNRWQTISASSSGSVRTTFRWLWCLQKAIRSVRRNAQPF